MTGTLDMEDHSPFTVRKIIPKFKSSTKIPQQRLRHDTRRFTIGEGNAVVQFENDELLLSSLMELKDDYGSYAPVTPINDSDNDSSEPTQQISSKRFFNGSEEGATSESTMAVEMNVPKTVRPSDLFRMGPSTVSKITKSLAKRIAIRRKGRPSAIVSPCYTPRDGNFADSPSCNSDAETEVRNNLKSRRVINEVSPTPGEFNQIEVWDTLASTFVGKEESLVEGLDFCTTNSLCEASGSNESGKKIRAKPKVLIPNAHCDGEIELLYSAAATITEEFDSRAIVPSGADSPLSLSSRSSITSASLSSKGSNSSNSSQGILLPPKRAIGVYDPFGNSDFSIPGVVRPHRRVHFSNMRKLNELSALDSLMKAHTSDTLPSDYSDDSSTSFDYLMYWCGGGIPEDFEEI
eukprot:CAMPEP_0201683570 /NCGR_PEP_ID=MMETSP0494-20130426/52194_1 /ASSEMBLY_ACC=CAM_ASM_000839 /TAXON_ID=420259 /ORGANISM="Thalassiosira gravida, Strain GMp14c1" /LENGTH=405 /DNA_ID=CAMNT_0048167349 /DNA_START=451 /DNA_END=1668 /DNA_ORIENTATION=-